MPIDAAEAADMMIKSVRARPWGLAVAGIADGAIEFALDPGDDELTCDSYFQLGSITKTMTGLLLADATVRGETTLSATVGSILGSEAGSCGHITLLELATQRSGLPRLPPNLDPAKVDRNDPYAEYAEDDLIEALRLVDRPSPGTYAYSNMGFMLLGLLLTRITGISYAELVKERLFGPLQMTDAVCGIPELGAMPGYNGQSRVPWWRNPIPGAGGTGASIKDLATYVAAHLSPPTSMASAIELAVAEHAPAPSPMGLAWGHQGGGQFHDGGTGGFRSIVAFHRPTGTGVALLANSQDAEQVTQIGFRVLTELARSRQ